MLTDAISQGGDDMRISDSSVFMTSIATSKTTYTEHERLDIQFDQPKQQSQIPLNQLKLYDQTGLAKSSIASLQGADTSDDYEDFYLEMSDEDKEKIKLLEKLLEALTGKRVKFRLPKHFKGKKANRNNPEAIKSASNPSQEPVVRYERKTHFKETSYMSFSSTGSVRTEDGRNIEFSLNIKNAHHYEAFSHEIVQIGGEMADPLVINFNTDSALLNDQKVSFDLTSDGIPEQISFVKSGSGFLAIDKNDDGIITDGSELFGPNSGNGFLELAAYDDDGNGWIDENDDVFDDLVIWTKDEAGNDQLFGLLKKDVGAIYLGNVSTSFGLKTTGNQLLGQIQSTGVYLKESGSVGSIQHVDLVI